MESTSLAYRFRLPAVLCALALLVCELVSHPFAEMGICDDWSYIHTAHHLAASGHIVYIGWAAAMLGWQLYLGALFIKLFGYSHTSARMATLLVAMAAAFFMQRSIVRALASSPHRERNATIGTLALVLSPLFLELSVTFMSDIYGVFAIIVCLYACIRALQAASANRAIGWLCFAAGANAIGGSARQVAWLGVLVMLPSTLWLLRSRRRVALSGLAATLTGVVFIIVCMHWFQHQPHALPSIPPTLLSKHFHLLEVLKQYLHLSLDVPFLLLPTLGIFLPQVRKSHPLILAALLAIALAYIAAALHYRHIRPNGMLLPTQGDWVTVYGRYTGMALQGAAPFWFNTISQILLTAIAIGGCLGLIASLTRTAANRAAIRPLPSDDIPPFTPPVTISGKQLATLLVPYTVAYLVLLIPVSTVALFDRYLLAPLFVAVLYLVRYYQDRVNPRLPAAAVVLLVVMTVIGIACTHNMFALYRARIAIASELRAAGIPATSVDAGWESNMPTELEHSPVVDYSLLTLPRGVYTPPPPPAGPCQMLWYFMTPHVHPIYAVSFSPNACAGPTPLPPVTYSRWLGSPDTLYLVKFTLSAQSYTSRSTH